MDQHEISGLNRYILDPKKTGKITPYNAGKAIKSFLSIRQELNGEEIIASDLFKYEEEAKKAMASLLKGGIIKKEEGNEPLFKHVSPEAVKVAVDTFYEGVPFPYNNKRPLTQSSGR